MKKLIMSALVGFAFLLPSQFVQANSDYFNDQSLVQDGTVNETTYKERRISDLYVEDTTIKGRKVKAELKIENGELNGNVVLHDEKGKVSEKLHLESTDKFETEKARGFNGIVNGGEKHFELYLHENQQASFNIFGLDDNGEREDPYTIHLNGDSEPKISTKIVQSVMPEEEEMQSEIGLMNSALEQLSGSANKVGLKAYSYSLKGVTAGTVPYITEVKTDVAGAKYLSSQPVNTITRTNLYQAQIENSFSTPGSFRTIEPDSSSKKTIDIPIMIKNRVYRLKFTTERTSVNSTSNTNPLRVWYQFTSRHASAFETDGLGAEAALALSINTPRNSSGQVVIYSKPWLKYEFIGNERDYYTVNGDFVQYYK